MGINCEVHLDHDTIYAGANLSGRIVYNCGSEETFDEITLNIYGHSSFDYSQGKYSVPELEKFLEYSATLYTTKLTPGLHSSRFSYTVPLGSPSSLKLSVNERLTYIKYWILIKRVTTFWTHEDVKKKFIVCNYVDLNKYPTNFQEPGNTTAVKDSFWCCCSSLPFVGTLQIPKKGFLPGENIPFILECNNHSSYLVESIKVFLRITFTLKRKFEEKYIQEYFIDSKQYTIAECLFGSLLPRQCKTWRDALNTPKIQPLNSDGCENVDIEYYVYFQAEFESPHNKIKGSIPVVIGHVPFGGKSDFSEELQRAANGVFAYEVIHHFSEIGEIKITHGPNNALTL